MALNFDVLARKHPRFDSAAYGFLNVLANSKIEIYNPSQKRIEWSEETGETVNEPEPIWRGFAVVTPNMDWRARDRRVGDRDTANHAYRVQLVHIDKNELVPRDQQGLRDLRIVPAYGQIVKIVEHNSDPGRVGLTMVVRNPTTDSDWWQPTLLCDIDAGDTFGSSY